MTSGPALCEHEVLVHRDGNETIDDSVHHDRFCLDPSGLEKWPFECFDHWSDATLAIVIVEHVSGTSSLDSLYFSAWLLCAWIPHSRGILQSGANVCRVVAGFDVKRAIRVFLWRKARVEFAFLQMLSTCVFHDSLLSIETCVGC